MLGQSDYQILLECHSQLEVGFEHVEIDPVKLLLHLLQVVLLYLSQDLHFVLAVMHFVPEMQCCLSGGFKGGGQLGAVAPPSTR